MNILSVLYAVSWVLLILGGAILATLPVGWIMDDSMDILLRMTYAGIIPIALGGIFIILTGRRERHYAIREGFGIVAISWLAAGVFGALPYIMVEQFHFYDALFETLSGFSTTGASVIDPTLTLRNGQTLPQGVESLSATLLFWRSLTQWLGGMGFVVLCVAILPFLGLGTQFLFSAESPAGSTSHQVATRIASASKILWGVYILFTVILMILLKTAGMQWFDALNHAFTTLATGGFSTKQASIAAFDSLTINSIISLFMIIAATNFILHARAMRGHPLIYGKDEEFRIYIFMIVLTIVIASVAILWQGSPMLLTDGRLCENDWENVINHVTFTVTSLISSTGYCTVDYTAWPILTVYPLLIIMLVCGCAGSTCGGLKQVRAILVVKHAIGQVRRCLFPHAKEDVRFSSEHVDQGIVYKALGFFIFYIFFTALIAFIVMILAYEKPEVLARMDMQTASSISLTCMSNVGPGYGNISPLNTFSWLTPSIKILLSFVMVVGRLELFTILVLFMPSFWRK